MSETKKRLFGKLLAKAVVQDVDKELRAADEKVTVSREHKRRMRYIARHGRLPRRGMDKRVLALIIAAVLLLAGCAILAREQIAGFFVTMLKDRNLYTTADTEGYPETIEKKMVPHTLPEVYTLVETDEDEMHRIMKWEEQSGNTLIFYQDIRKGFRMGADNEHGEWVTREICGKQVWYYDDIRGRTQFLWMDEYVYHFSSSRRLTDAEVESIMENLYEEDLP